MRTKLIEKIQHAKTEIVKKDQVCGRKDSESYRNLAPSSLSSINSPTNNKMVTNLQVSLDNTYSNFKKRTFDTLDQKREVFPIRGTLIDIDIPMLGSAAAQMKQALTSNQ